MKRVFALGLIFCLLCGCAREEAGKTQTELVTALTEEPGAFPLSALDGVSLTPPEGFTASEDGRAFYAPGYPKDGSNIMIHTAEVDPLFDAYTPELVLAALESTYLNALGVTPEVTIDEFTFTTLRGFPALRLQYHFVYSGIPMTCLQYVVEADVAYTFTFIQVGGADWMSAFETSAASIGFAWRISQGTGE